MDRQQANGIELLFEQPHSRPALLRVDEAALRKWSKQTSMEIWQAVLLYSFADPESLAVGVDQSIQVLRGYDALFSIGKISYPPVPDDWCLDERRLWKSVLDVANAAEHGAFRTEAACQAEPWRAVVRVSEFAAWARKAKLPVIGDWPTRASLQGDQIASGCWPWGRYETESLRVLAAAVDRYWRPVSDGGTYDPTSGARRSSIEEIADWIVKTHGVKADRARYIAKIIRPDDLQYGRIPSDE